LPGGAVAMKPKQLACLLVALLMWGWVDDLIASPYRSDDLATSDDDQYLPAGRLPGHGAAAEQSSRSPYGLPVQTAGAAPTPPLPTQAPPSAALPLASTDPVYAFMSLQR